MTKVSAERLGASLDVDNTQYGRDGAPYVDAIPILSAASIEGAEGVMALDLAGVARVIVERIFDRYEFVQDANGDFVRRGVYEEGFCDRSELYYAHRVLNEDGGESWVLGDQVTIGGLDKRIGELVSRLSQLREGDNLLTPVRAARFVPGNRPTIGIYSDGVMQLVAKDDPEEEPDLVTPEKAGIIPGNPLAVDVEMNGLTHVLASPESVIRVCLGPEDPTVIEYNGIHYMFITLAVQSVSGWRFETLMVKGPSLTELEAVGFVPLGMMKELSFGPVYETEDGDKRVVLGEGSFTGYSTGRVATVGAEFALDSFKDDGLVSLFPANVRDRFAYYAGSTDTPKDQRHQWLGEHISPNKVIDQEAPRLAKPTQWVLLKSASLLCNSIRAIHTQASVYGLTTARSSMHEAQSL
jgi:hypothetical protein